MKLSERLSEVERHAAEHSKVAAAWAVHVFTGTGVVLGLLALFATLEGRPLHAFMWLGLALFIDGIDGTLARRFKVTERVPHFDGAALDLVVDYTNYVIIPALMIYQFAMVPPGWGIPAACVVAATSLYCFANLNMKTSDYYFQGFPAVWNVVVLYMFILRTPDWVNLAVVAVCAVLTFVPWKYVHPLRVARFRPATIAMTGVWCFTAAWLLFAAERPPHPATSEPTVFGLFIIATLYFAAVSFLRSADAEPD
jgi:phosphatidylcholine synthase